MPMTYVPLVLVLLFCCCQVRAKLKEGDCEGEIAIIIASEVALRYFECRVLDDFVVTALQCVSSFCPSLKDS